MKVLTDVAAFCGAVLVILGFLAAISRIRWVRWCWRRLVSDPLASWLRRVVLDGAREWHAEAVEPRLAAIEKQLMTNGGTTLRDEVVVTRVLAERALGVAERIAADRGILPAGVDPTERRVG